MRKVLMVVVASAIAHAHVVSTSSGELKIDGAAATFELRIPAYEVEHVANPETALLNEVWFKGSTRTSGECARDDDEYVCRASYAFESPVGDSLESQITLHRATVPNHIHLLTASQGGNFAQEIFDQVTPLRELRFRPPSLLAQLWRDARTGAGRLLRSIPALLFLLALALTAQSRREAVGLAIAFFVGEWAVRPISALLPTGFAPEFLDAMLALTVAYLAAEVLWLPAGRARWAIVPLLGLAHGLPFAPYPAGYMGGAMTVQAVALGSLAILPIAPLRRRLAMLLLVAGLAYFAWVMFF